MKNNLTFSKYFDNIGAEYLTGALSKCWDTWRYEKVVPSYDKFYYIVDGEFYLKIDGKEYIAKKGQMFLLPYNSTQTYYHISENHVTKYWFHCVISCKDHDLMELITLPHFIEVDSPDTVTELFKKILYYDKYQSITSKIQQNSCILRLLAYYIDKSNIASEKAALKDEKLESLMMYIEDNIHNDISINELCNVVHFHPNYFIRYFKEATGSSPMCYINNLRIENAKKLLQTKDDSIKDIALSVGFKSSYYFSRIFKKTTGFTPTDYRLISTSRPVNTGF